jgi:hypothetical protein
MKYSYDRSGGAREDHPLQGLQVYRRELMSLPDKLDRTVGLLKGVSADVELAVRAFKAQDYSDLLDSTKSAIQTVGKARDFLVEIESQLRSFD